LDPTYAIAYHSRGGSRYYLGQYEQAIQDLDEAIKLDPAYAIAYAWRSTIHGYLGNSTEADRGLQKATELGYTP
jgi:tetratricopeptide (TPR) repeat protein